MKRHLCLILSLCLLLGGCGYSDTRFTETVTFYYLRNTYQSGASDGVIAGEDRQVPADRDSLSYLLSLYLMGPAEDDLRLPLPQGTRILAIEQNEQSVHLTLSEDAGSLTDVEFSLAAACLTMTCIGLTGVQTVTAACGEHSVTMGADSLTLFDTITEETTEETQ